jgi:membrane protease YdiL (CAAX protease family)
MATFSTTHKEKLRLIFHGSQGLRAGWSILIFAALLAPAVFIANIVMRHLPSLREGQIALGDSLIFEAVQLVAILGAMAITAWIEGRDVWAYYGLAGRRPIAKLLFGLGGGFVCLSLVVMALNAGGYLVFDGRALQGLAALGYGLFWLLDFMMVGIREEALFRGYLQSTLTRGIGFWPAAILLSLLFGAGHLPNAGENVPGIIGVMVHALFYCLLLRLSGSLWLAIGFHAAWDWAQSYFYGTPQSGHVMQGHLFMTHTRGDVLMSGGGAGPEGSLLGLPAQAIGLFVFLWAVKRAGLFLRGWDGPGAPAQAPVTQSLPDE